MRVSELLQEGRENAVQGHKLVKLLELKELRDLTQLIEAERRAGFPICASTGQGNPGYYLAADAAELEKYIGSLDRRLHHVGQTRRHLEATLLKMTGQGKLGGCYLEEHTD